MKKRILILTTRFPYPLMGGDKIRIFNLCRYLAAHFEVTLLVIAEGRIRQEFLRQIDREGVKTVLFEFAPLRFKLNALMGIFSVLPLQVRYYYFRSVQRWVDRHLQDYDLVFCNHIRSTEYVRDKL